MKYLFSLLLVVTLFSFRFVEDIYSLSIQTIDGKKIALSEFKGKKMLFIILPLSEQDTSVRVEEIQDLQNKYDTSIVVIGIPALEDGYTKEKNKTLKRLYKSAHPGFILAEGMKVKKGSGAEQALIFQWLTNRLKNTHFDMDVQGPGHKFFVDEAGELYAMMGPKVSLSDQVINKILTRQKSNEVGK